MQKFRILSPCSADWEAMPGDGRVRFCGQCRKHVYNFAAMDRGEAERVAAQADGNICARVAQGVPGRRGFLRATAWFAAAAISLRGLRGDSSSSRQVQVTVVDPGGAPMGGVHVDVFSSHNLPVAAGDTDREGKCTLAIPDALGYQLRIAYPGFEDFEADLDAKNEVRATLRIAPTLMGEVVAVAPKRHFWNRK